VAPERAAAVLDAATAAGVPAVRLGVAGGDRIVADGAFSVSVADATTAWRDAIPAALSADSAPASSGTSRT
jgi:phosphoribosylformylglycinamidine synthase subunit PurL